MGFGNVPDDWGMYYTNCSLCGSRYHMSEGGCGCLEEKQLCSGPNCGVEYDGASYHDDEDVTEGGGKYYCSDCLACECCETSDEVTYNDEADLLLCPACAEEDHYCAASGPLLDHIEKVTRD